MERKINYYSEIEVGGKHTFISLYLNCVSGFKKVKKFFYIRNLGNKRKNSRDKLSGLCNLQ